MDKIINNLKSIANGILYLSILVLLVILHFKNIRIENLKNKINQKPPIEYVYVNKVDTLKIEYPVPKIQRDTVVITLPILSNKDSSQIVQEYYGLYSEYSRIKEYDDILRNDSLAFIQLKEKVQYNRVYDRELIYQHKTPIIYKGINEVTNSRSKFSLVGGIEGNFDGLSIGGGVVTTKNSVYTINYDPFNKGFRVGIYYPIFNF